MKKFLQGLLIVTILIAAVAIINGDVDKQLEKCNGNKYCELNILKGV